MQEILHTAIIAIPATFAALMVLDLIANLKQLWIDCNPSTPLSTPASTPQQQLEVAAPAAESKELELVPDPWEFDASAQPIITTPRLTVVRKNVLLLPPAKTKIEVAEVVASTKRRGRPKQSALAPAPVAAPKRRGRPRKSA